MALKSILKEEEFGKLADHLKAEYAEKVGTDGKKSYWLAVDPVDGYMLDNPTKLQKALEAERAAVRELKVSLAGYDGLDAAAARDAIERLKTAPTNEKVDAQVAAAVKRAEETWGAKLKDAETKGGAYKSALEREMIDGRISHAVGKHGGRPTLLIPVIRSRVQMVEDGKGGFSVKVLGDDGQPLYSQQTAKSHEPMGLEEFVGSLKNNDDFAAAFAGSGTVGGGTKPDASPRGGGSFTISKADLSDPLKYRAAKAAAEKAGQELQLAD